MTASPVPAKANVPVAAAESAEQPVPAVAAELFDDLRRRGLVHQTTDPEGLGAWLAGGVRTVYAGFDPTADSLHVGHLVALLLLRRFQQAGHRPIALVGGATGMIGDPSGRSAERNLLSVEQLEANVAALRAQIGRLLDFDHPTNPAILVNNFDWMKDYGFLAFLRDIGKCFPVNVMLAKDSVRSRLEREDSGLSYTEFSYMLLQAYDFVRLNRDHGCELQIGGSDQWGNITAGIDLGRRLHGAALRGMTNPLLTKSDGEKMGKTAKGAVWLSAEKTSPFAFYQYWINVEDADVGKCLRYFTDISCDELDALDAARAADPGKRESQKRLALELTRLVHGEEGLTRAQKATSILFGAEITALADGDLTEIFADVPSKELARDRLTAGLPLIDAFVEAGLCNSRGDSKRNLAGGGAYVNNRRETDPERLLTPADLAGETTLVLRAGKKKYALLKFTA